MVIPGGQQMTTTSDPSQSTSAWAPLRSPVYRALWIAQLVSNLGTWMQTVGAQWMLVGDARAAILVPLVQTATTLPIMLLALPSGVLADLIDRRRLLIATQGAMAAGVGLLASLTGAGLASPAVLLTLLFLIGCGQALVAPAWQAIQPDLVPAQQIPAAAALGSMSINLARAIGPAIAGLLISLSGPTLVFALNAGSFVLIVILLVCWRRAPVERKYPPEQALAALSAGGRFIRSAPVVRRILLRAALFVVPASALWALLPVIAKDQLQLSSAGYGLLLGALGTGAVLGAFQLSWLRRRFSQNILLAGAAIGFAVSTLVVTLVPVFPVVLASLLLGGASWLLSLSTLHASMQLSLPSWVRARGLSVHQLVFMGSQAVASLLWGLLADATTSIVSLLISAALLVLCGVSSLWWPLHARTGSLDLTPSSHWPEPTLAFDPAPRDGPVLVTTSYRVAPADEAEFLRAMTLVSRSRQRTGAAQWRLFRSVGQESTFYETFVVRSWGEHMRQHHTRLTGQDRMAEECLAQYTDGPPSTEHYVEVRPV